MPLPTPLPVPTAALSRRRPPSRVGVLVLTAFGLAALATVTGHATGLALLIGATVVLGVAAALAMRAHWAAALPVEPRTPVFPAPAAEAADGDSVTAELRRLHAAHVEKVNLARELADSYTDQALALLARS